jgi:hypothetical protein
MTATEARKIVDDIAEQRRVQQQKDKCKFAESEDLKAVISEICQIIKENAEHERTCVRVYMRDITSLCWWSWWKWEIVTDELRKQGFEVVSRDCDASSASLYIKW